MKIGFLIKALSSGGAERATVSLANYFSTHSDEVEIITFNGTDSFYPLEKDVRVRSAQFDKIEQATSIKRLLGSIKRVFAIRNLVKAQGFDVLIGMSFAMTWYTVLATIFTHTKSVGTERSNPYKYKASKLYTFLRKFFHLLTDGYVLQTRRAAEFFGNVKTERDIIIPNAIFNEAVYSLSPPNERKKIICSAGRLIESKRFDLLIDAFAKIAKQVPGYMLMIFGEGEERAKLEEQIKNLDLEKRVVLFGATPEAVKLINHASVFVLSSDYEGMPNALLEALAMGVPCISTDCETGPAELIENGVNGILTEPGNCDELAEAMLKVIQNPELAKQFSENGRKLLQTNSIENISQIWLDYLNIL